MPKDTYTENSTNNRLRSIIALIIFAIVATLIINLIAQKTQQDITANQATHAMQTISEVLPPDNHNNEPHLDVIWLSDMALPGSQSPLPAYRARFDQEVTATVITAIADAGYVGPIKLLISINNEGKIIRVRAIEHRETPGLGDKIEPKKSNWINLFDGADLGTAADWSLRRDGGKIDHISGATITSRVVTQTVHATLKYYLANSTVIHAARDEPKE
ncbi:MAG: RnfABCDGE type electron transport complex subunit G [Gammaproteobacteria bacterium]|nr:RnfABCDGE type electron transport complex subunit G [Gammaproteobacteria bacterium]